MRDKIKRRGVPGFQSNFEEIGLRLKLNKVHCAEPCAFIFSPFFSVFKNKKVSAKLHGYFLFPRIAQRLCDCVAITDYELQITDYFLLRKSQKVSKYANRTRPTLEWKKTSLDDILINQNRTI